MTKRFSRFKDKVSTAVAYAAFPRKMSKAVNQQFQADKDLKTINTYRGFGSKVTGEPGHDNPSFVAKSLYDDVKARRTRKIY